MRVLPRAQIEIRCGGVLSLSHAVGVTAPSDEGAEGTVLGGRKWQTFEGR